MNLPFGYVQVFRVAVPPTTKWQPDLAHQMMVSLFAFTQPLVVGIRATAQTIQWYIETPQESVEAITQLLYSCYPQAGIAISPKTFIPLGYRRYPFHAAQPFIFPLKSAASFSNLDPLATLVNGLAHLREDETIIYELALTPPRPEYPQLGRKLFQELAGQASATVWKEWQAKLEAPLKEVTWAVKIKAATAQRADDLAGHFWPALALFEYEGFNVVVPPGDKSFQFVLSPGEVAALWHLPTDQCQVPRIVWASAAVAPIPLRLVQQTQGVMLGTNVYQGRVQPVRLAYEDRVAHVNLIGRTRVGKSTLLHHMIHQDIAAGKGVALIDPHGDLVKAVLATSVPAGRERDVVLFDTRDQDYPIGLNLLAVQPGVSQEATASYALTVIRKMFAEQWSGGRMEMVLDAALRTLVAVPGSTIQDVPKLLLDAKFRRQVLKQLDEPATLDFWYDEYNQESPAQQREFTRPISHRIRKFYRDPTVQRIVCEKDSLNFRQILDQGKIFLANLGGLAEIEAETLGVLLISKLQLAAMSRSAVPLQQRTPFYVYVDEVQNFITTSLSKVFSEAGKYGLSLIVANQYLKQLEGDTLAALMGNVGTTVIFAVGPEDARALTPFVKPEFTVEDLVRLDRFAAVVKMQLGGQSLLAFSLQAAPPLGRPDDAEERIARMRQYSRKQYARPKEEVDAELMSRYEHSEFNEADEAREDYFD